MRSLAFVISLSFQSFAFSEPIGLPPIAPAAEKFAQAMNSNDFASVADLTHPSVVELVGGRESFISVLQQRLSNIPPVTDLTFEAAGEVVKVPAGFAAIVPYNATMQVEKGTLLTRSFYIAYLAEGDKSWRFIDGNGAYTPGALEFLFPGYDNELPIPEKRRPVLIPKAE